MKSHVYLESMTPDGKVGAVKEILYDDAPQQYLEPIPYFTANDAALDKIRKAVAAAETELRHAESRNAPATDIMRLEQALVSAKAELAAAERPRRQLFGYRLRDGIEKTS
jgi:hypothetical protein